MKKYLAVSQFGRATRNTNREYRFAVIRQGGRATFHGDHILATKEASSNNYGHRPLPCQIIPVYEVIRFYKNYVICLTALGDFIVIRPDDSQVPVKQTNDIDDIIYGIDQDLISANTLEEMGSKQ